MILIAFLGLTNCLASNPRTGAAIRNGVLESVNGSRTETPLAPEINEFQKDSIPIPIDETTPTPEITTSRFEFIQDNLDGETNRLLIRQLRPPEQPASDPATLHKVDPQRFNK